MKGASEPFSTVFALLILSSLCPAHDSLYHYIEIRIPREQGPAELAFSVHAADLDLARELGADPTGPGLEWLREHNDKEIGALLVEARAFIATSFALSVNEGAFEPYADALRLPTPALLREDPDAIEGARPGFIVGLLPLPREAATLRLRYSEEGDKRLLLVVNRPGAFPQVRDLAPGDTATLTLASPLP